MGYMFSAKQSRLIKASRLLFNLLLPGGNTHSQTMDIVGKVMYTQYTNK